SGTRPSMRIVAAVSFAALVCFWGPLAEAQAPFSEPLPIQDNELIIGISGGVFFAPEQPSEQSRDLVIRVGGEHEVFGGPLNRATDWLDVDLVVGFHLMWLAGDGFKQRTPTGERRHNVVPGMHVRGTARWVIVPMGPTLALGLVGAVSSAPAEGFVTRFLLEAALGWDVFRNREHHVAVEGVYGWPLD